jgi:ABC-2 type transport system ATP-binding protein
MSAKDLVLETRDLTKSFGATRALDGLSFGVPRGSIFGFLGPNGAGKTTTFSILCGFVRPSSGSATVLGQPVGRVRSLGARLAALPQDARFVPSRSVGDSLRYLAELGGMPRHRIVDEVDRVLSVVGLKEADGVRGRALSHGMAKRFGLAQAFLGQPELVLLDEPTEGLDPRNAQQVRRVVRELATSATVVVSSHNLAEVQDLCDRAAILSAGKLVTTGSMEELTATDERVVITLGPGATDHRAALQGLAFIEDASWDQADARLRLDLRLGAKDSPEHAITEALSLLIAEGASISTVHRGQALQERFLRVT